MKFALALLAVCLGTLPFASVLTTGEAVTVADDPILEIDATTLTAYLADATPVQGVRPRVQQRGVELDGSMRSAPGLPMAINGNPFGGVWGGGTHNGVRLDLGTWSQQEVDIALPAPGFSWVIGRSYNARQETSTPAHLDSNGPQGVNWFQSSQPEIVLWKVNGEEGADDNDDILYCIYGADRFVEFDRVDDDPTTDTFKATNGAAGIFVFTDGGEDADRYTLTDQRGYEIVFFGFDDDQIDRSVAAPRTAGGRAAQDLDARVSTQPQQRLCRIRCRGLRGTHDDDLDSGTRSLQAAHSSGGRPP